MIQNEMVRLFSKSEGYDPITHKVGGYTYVKMFTTNITNMSAPVAMRDYGVSDASMITARLVKSIKSDLDDYRYVGYEGSIYVRVSKNRASRMTSYVFKDTGDTYQVDENGDVIGYGN